MLSVTIDLSALQPLADLSQLERIGNEAAASLALLTQAKVEELAGEKLHSRLDMFRKNLSIKQEDSGVWIIHLDAEADWIEEGVKAHSMVSDLLKSPKAKISEKGEKYLVVPFAMTSGKSGPTQTTNVQQQLVQSVKKQLKDAKISFGKIEKDASGMPLLGTLHKLNLSTPSRKDWAQPGHGHGGAGWGPPGYPMIGATGIPFLAGAQVTQSLNSKGKVERSVMTFRVVKEGHEQEGRWYHPGLEPLNAFGQAYDWAMRELETNVYPDIMRKIEQLSSSISNKDF